MRLLTPDTNNAKTIKGRAYGFATAVLYLAPVNLSGHNVCPKASAGCAAACLNTAGRGGMEHTQKSRLAKTRYYFSDRPAFMSQLVRELANHEKWSRARGFVPMVRLNGTSDIPWERVKVPFENWHETLNYSRRGAAAPNVMALFPDVTFYDYTKVIKRALAAAARGPDWPANYSLVFSRSESNHSEAVKALAAGANVAVVYRGAVPAAADRETFAPVDVPAREPWAVVHVVDGDRHDVRTEDGRGVIVGLTAKGRAKHDQTGFVIG